MYGDAAVRAVDYLYDVENRWIGRDVDLRANGQIDSRTRFAYDGNQIVLQFDRATAPSDDPAEPLSVADLSHRYLWNPAAVDQLMADEHVTTPDTPGSILWPLADHLGTIRDLAAYEPATDTTTVVNHRTFDAYGNLLSQTNPAHNTLFAFTARPLDQETRLQNNLHRWYDAKTGRWMSEDPIGFEGRDGNLARYVVNSPTLFVDPNGLWLGMPSWSDYSHYFWNPSDMDRGLRYGQYTAYGMIVVGGGGAVSVKAVGVGGIVVFGGSGTAGSASATATLSAGAKQVLLRYGTRAQAMAALAQLQEMLNHLQPGSVAYMKLVHRIDQFEAAINEAFKHFP